MTKEQLIETLLPQYTHTHTHTEAAPVMGSPITPLKVPFVFMSRGQMQSLIAEVFIDDGILCADTC